MLHLALLIACSSQRPAADQDLQPVPFSPAMMSHVAVIQDVQLNTATGNLERLGYPVQGKPCSLLFAGRGHKRSARPLCPHGTAQGILVSNNSCWCVPVELIKPGIVLEDSTNADRRIYLTHVQFPHGPITMQTLDSWVLQLTNLSVAVYGLLLYMFFAIVYSRYRGTITGTIGPSTKLLIDHSGFTYSRV